MLEMKVFRESPEKILEDWKKRNLSKNLASDVIDLDNQWRTLIEKGNRLRAKRNVISKSISELKKKGQDYLCTFFPSFDKIFLREVLFRFN